MSAEERRRLLVEAALRVMTRDGVAAATTRAIVAEADMPLGVFHYCFRAKEDLLAQVMGTISAGSFDAVPPALGELPEEASVADVVDLAVEAYCQHIERDPARHLVSYELTQYALRAAPEAAQAQYDGYFTLCRRFLTATADATGSAWDLPLDTLARLLLAVVEGCTLQWLVDRDGTATRATLRAFGRELVTLARPVSG